MSSNIRTSKTYFMTSTSIITALICLLGPISIPFGPIPVSLTNFIIYLSVIILGLKGSTISYLIYLLLGLAGLPVFSGFQGGISKLIGPTGGYLIGFIFVCIIGGFCSDKSKGKIKIPVITTGIIISTLITYLLGTLWFVKLTGTNFISALSVCVFPFIPFDLLKIILALIIAFPIKSRLIKAKLLY